MSKQEKKWRGTWPAHCDICKIDLRIPASFIDGATQFGPWALMCPVCHEKHGVGLGTGKGQEYDSKTLKKIYG